MQCLVLDPDSIGVAHDILNLSVGNHGVLRQIDDTNRIARFCRSDQLGTTETVHLSTGESVSCTYTRTWPKYPDAEISGRAAAATSPAAAADAATNARAAAPAAVRNAVPSEAGDWLDSKTDGHKLRDWFRKLKRRPGKLIYLLRKNAVLSGIDIPGSSADITTEGVPAMSDSAKQRLIKEEYNNVLQMLDVEVHLLNALLTSSLNITKQVRQERHHPMMLKKKSRSSFSNIS